MTNILRVSASDEDADNNGAIKYSLTAPYDPSDINYFDIQPESGWIFLKKPLDVSSIFYSPLNTFIRHLKPYWKIYNPSISVLSPYVFSFKMHKMFVKKTV